MEFEWDEAKSNQNLQLRGFGFDDAFIVFADPHRVTFIDDRRDYGETRWITFGEIEGRLYVVVFTKRDDVIRIISARKANEKERERYDDYKTQSESR